MKNACLIGLLALAGGCEIWDPRPGLRDFFWGLGDQSIPDPNEEIRKKEYPTWPKEIRQAVDAREVQVGMTKNQVLLALRLAEKDIQKQLTDTETGKVENWTVWRTAQGWSAVRIPLRPASYPRTYAVPVSYKVTLTFRDGTVSQIQTQHPTYGVSVVERTVPRTR